MLRTTPQYGSNGGVVGNPITTSRQYLKAPAVGVDIGGTLAKLALYCPNLEDCVEQNDYCKDLRDFVTNHDTIGSSGFRDDSYECELDILKGKIYFLLFDSYLTEDAIDYSHKKNLVRPGLRLAGTGGGAHKYAKKFEETFQIPLQKEDELQTLVRGMSFMMENSTDQCYTLINNDGIFEKINKPMDGPPYPFLLCNCGSGVSILRIDNQNICERVGGSCLGGATFFGLMSKLFEGVQYNECIEWASRGHSQNADMLVRDIYGGDYQQFNLKGTVVASSLGKLIYEETRRSIQREDIASAVLHMIVNNITSIVYLHARRYNINRIVFSGNFLRGNSIAMRCISNGLHYWSEGTMQPLFLRHEGYFGAIGAFLTTLEIGKAQFKLESPKLVPLSVEPEYNTMKPIINIKKYQWSDSTDIVTVVVKDAQYVGLRGEEIKCNFQNRSVHLTITLPDQIYELKITPLRQLISPDKSSWLLDKDEIILRLCKERPKEWDILIIPIFIPHMKRKRNTSCYY